MVKVEKDDLSLTSSLFNTPLPENRSDGYSITIGKDNNIILVGGYQSNYTKLATVFEGTLNENADDLNWLKLPSMKRKRYYHAAFNLENKLYVLGGIDDSHEWQDSSEVFDVVKRKWSDGPTLLFVGQYRSAVTSHNNPFSLVVGSKIINSGNLRIIIFNNELVFNEIASIGADAGYCCLSEVHKWNENFG